MLRRSLLAGTALAGSLLAGLAILPAAAMTAGECGTIPYSAGANYTVACGQGPYNFGISYGNLQTGNASNTIFDFSDTQATGTTGHAAVSLSSGNTGGAIEVDIRQISPGPAPTFQGGSGANGFSVTTGGSSAPIIFNMGAGSITGGSSGFGDGTNGVSLSTTGRNSSVAFDLTGGTITGGGAFIGGSNGVLITTSEAGSDINFATSADTSITAAHGNGVELHAGEGSSIGSDPTNNTINGSITSTQLLSQPPLGLLTPAPLAPVGIGTGWLGTANGSGNVTQNVGATGIVSGSGAGLVGTTVNGNVNFTVDGQVNQTSSIAGTLTAPLLLPVGIGGEATGNGNVNIITNAGSSVSEVGATPYIPATRFSPAVPSVLGTGILGVTLGSGSTTLIVNGYVTASGVGAGAISNSGNSSVTIGSNVTITGAPGSHTAYGVGTVGAYALSTSGAATANLYGGTIGGAALDTSPDIGLAAIVLRGSQDATVNVGGGTNPASTIYANQTGVMATNGGTGNVVITNTLDSNSNQNTVNSGGTGILGTTTGGGNVTIDAGVVNSGLASNGGFDSSGVVAEAEDGGAATVNLHGAVNTNGGTFGALAFANGGNATVTSDAGISIDPPVGMAAVTAGSGLASVANNALVTTTEAGLFGGNFGDGAVLITNNSTGDVEANSGDGIVARKFGPNSNPVDDSPFSVVVGNEGIVNAPDGAGISVSAFDHTHTAANNVLIYNQYDSAMITGEGDRHTAAVDVRADGSVQVDNYDGATINTSEGTDGMALRVRAGDDIYIDNSRGAAIDGLAKLDSWNGSVTFDNSRGATWDSSGVSHLSAEDDTTINNFDGARIKLETDGGALVMHAGGDATINNYNGAHFTMLGINANVMVADGDATINNYNGASFNLAGLNGNLMFAGGDATINNYNGARFNLLGLNGSLLVANENATINNYNGASINLIGNNEISLVAANGIASINNYNGARIVSIGASTFTLNDAEVNNSANSGGNDAAVGGCGADEDFAGICVIGASTYVGAASTLQFNNAGGLVSMINGVTGDQTIIQNGNFNATGGSQLGVDSYLGKPGSASDMLIVNGNVTGKTSIIVNDVNAGPGAYNPKGIAIVDVTGTGTKVGGSNVNWVLDPASNHYDTLSGTPVLDKGLFNYFLAQDPNGNSQGCVDGAGQCVSLYSVPGQVAQELPIALTAAQDLWQETALMWEDRQSEIRDWLARPVSVPVHPGLIVKGPAPRPIPGAGPGIWAKAIGSWTSRSDSTSESLAGHTFNFDLGYKQESFGIIGGAEFGKADVVRPGDALIFGAMGGYIESHLNFNAGGTYFVYTGGTVGASVSYITNGFFIDGLAKADLLRLQLNTPSLIASPDSVDFNGASVGLNTVGGIGNIGYRFNAGQYFVEPIGTLTYSETHIDSLNALRVLGANINFGNGESLRGALGGRVGVDMPSIAGRTMEAWVMGRVWDEFLGNNNSVDIQNAGPDAILTDNFHKVFGEVKGGLTLITPVAGWSGFVDAGVKFNDQFNTVTAKGGLNYQW